MKPRTFILMVLVTALTYFLRSFVQEQFGLRYTDALMIAAGIEGTVFLIIEWFIFPLLDRSKENNRL